MASIEQNGAFRQLVVAASEQATVEQVVPADVLRSLLDVFGIKLSEVPEEVLADAYAVMLGYADDVRREFGRIIGDGLLSTETLDVGSDTVLSAIPEQMAAPYDGDDAQFYIVQTTGEIDGGRVI